MKSLSEILLEKLRVTKNSVSLVDELTVEVPYYEFDDQLPYGHGEKSVYMIAAFMKLSDEEAFAIRYHMGFSGSDPVGNVGKAFEMYPLAFAVSTADMEATYFCEKEE